MATSDRMINNIFLCWHKKFWDYHTYRKLSAVVPFFMKLILREITPWN